MVFSVRMYSGDSFLSVLKQDALTDTSYFTVWERVGKIQEFGHSYRFLLLLFRLYQEVLSGKGDFTLHGFGSVKNALCCS